MDDQTTIVYLNDTIDRLIKEKDVLQGKLDSVTELVSFYAEHYTELGHKDTARKFKELKEDVENAIAFKE